MIIPGDPDDSPAPASGQGLGLLDVGHGVPADAVQHGDRPVNEPGVAVRLEPFARRRERAGRVLARGRDQNELVGGHQDPRYGRGAGVGQGQRVAGGEQLEDPGDVLEILPGPCARGLTRDHLGPRRRGRP